MGPCESIQIYEGASARASNNIYLGEVALDLTPSAEDTVVVLQLHIDASRVISADIEEKGTQRTKRAELAKLSTQLTDAELETLNAELPRYEHAHALRVLEECKRHLAAELEEARGALGSNVDLLVEEDVGNAKQPAATVSELDSAANEPDAEHDATARLESIARLPDALQVFYAVRDLAPAEVARWSEAQALGRKQALRPQGSVSSDSEGSETGDSSEEEATYATCAASNNESGSESESESDASATIIADRDSAHEVEEHAANVLQLDARLEEVAWRALDFRADVAVVERAGLREEAAFLSQTAVTVVRCAGEEPNKAQRARMEDTVARLRHWYLSRCLNIIAVTAVPHAHGTFSTALVMERVDQNDARLCDALETLTLSQLVVALHDIGMGLLELHTRVPADWHGALCLENVCVSEARDVFKLWPARHIYEQAVETASAGALATDVCDFENMARTLCGRVRELQSQVLPEHCDVCAVDELLSAVSGIGELAAAGSLRDAVKALTVLR